MIKAITCVQIITAFPQQDRQQKKRNSDKRKQNKKVKFNLYLEKTTFDIRM